MKIDLSRSAPPGYDTKWEVSFWCTGMVLAGIYSMGFFIRLMNELQYLKNRLEFGRHDFMPDCAEIIGNALFGFVILAVCMSFFAVMHYVYHWQGSKSIYVMRRLPSRFELHRRCLALPLLGAALSLIAAFLLLCLYYGIYMLATPDEFITPGQWYTLWRWML